MKTIGKYQVSDEIGRSPAGVTCRARDPFRNREYALKILSPLAALSAPGKDQLYRDLAVSWDLSHRHIAKVRDVGELEGGVYIATELLSGSSFGQFLATSTLTVSEKLGLLAQVCEALACAHSQGIAHGNLKPGNIFITDTRNAAILDFGTGIWQSLLLSSGVRLNGLLPNYLAPEQILGEPFDARSDIFAVGVILYEALRGQYPWQAPANLLPREIVHAEPEPLRNWDTLIPAELEEIIVRAMKKDPKNRIQTVDELAANLFVLAQHVRRDPPPPRMEVPLEPPTSVVTAPVESQPAASFHTVPVETVPPPVPEPEPELAPTAFGPPPVVSAPPVQPVAASPADAPTRITAPAVTPIPPVPTAPPTRVPVGHALWQPSTPPPPNPKKSSSRMVTFAIGAIMALSMVGVIVVRQNQGAPAANHQGAAQAATPPRAGESPAAAPDRQKPTPVESASAAKPAALSSRPPAEPAPEQPSPEQILRWQVKPLWEAGQYAQAMRLVDEVLADSPANAEARGWKKKIRAAQEAEAAVK
jgi:serine/threonine protein kinase